MMSPNMEHAAVAGMLGFAVTPITARVKCEFG
jgi:hypothetical protein